MPHLDNDNVSKVKLAFDLSLFYPKQLSSDEKIESALQYLRNALYKNDFHGVLSGILTIPYLLEYLISGMF